MEEGGYEFLVNFRWPHQGFALGYELISATEEEPYNTVLLFLGCVTIIYNFD